MYGCGFESVANFRRRFESLIRPTRSIAHRFIADLELTVFTFVKCQDKRLSAAFFIS